MQIGKLCHVVNSTWRFLRILSMDISCFRRNLSQEQVLIQRACHLQLASDLPIYRRLSQLGVALLGSFVFYKPSTNPRLAKSNIPSFR
jgi:hypothetical protein